MKNMLALMFYIPPFAMGLQRMGHPNVAGQAERTARARVTEWRDEFV
jgi:hypothetical protein